jgi:hypothetical protein
MNGEKWHPSLNAKLKGCINVFYVYYGTDETPSVHPSTGSGRTDGVSSASADERMEFHLLQHVLSEPE